MRASAPAGRPAGPPASGPTAWHARARWRAPRTHLVAKNLRVRVAAHNDEVHWHWERSHIARTVRLDHADEALELARSGARLDEFGPHAGLERAVAERLHALARECLREVACERTSFVTEHRDGRLRREQRSHVARGLDAIEPVGEGVACGGLRLELAQGGILFVRVPLQRRAAGRRRRARPVERFEVLEELC